MTKIHPFRAIRPTRDKAQLVSTRPLAAYRKHVLRAKLDENPYSFLHIIHPEGHKNHLSKANTKERFDAIRERFQAFKEERVFIQEEKPSFYVYRQTKGTHEFTGIIAGVSIDEYNQDRIKKHEATITSREAMFSNYLQFTGFNAEPVLLSHQPIQGLDTILEHITAKRPEYEFSTTDRIKHELWVVSDELEKLIQLFDPIQKIYIADGHHRSSSSARLKHNLLANGEKHYTNHDYFLGFLIDEKKLEILEFNRLVRHLNNLSEKQFLKACEKYFSIEPLKKARKPEKVHEIICVLEKNSYKFTPLDQYIDEQDPVKHLDAQILTDYILEPILGIEDLKTSKDIDFLPGTYGMKKIHEMIKKDEFKAAFLLYPVSVDDVKKVADAGQIMPPKSTWVEPKIRSGLTIYNINE